MHWLWARSMATGLWSAESCLEIIKKYLGLYFGLRFDNLTNY
jgi:hypothetical protein